MTNRLMSLEEVLEVLRGRVRPVLDAETVTLDDGLGRVLAADVVSPLDVPAFDNSRMDGYAVRAADGSGPLPVTLNITAGDAPQPLPAGSAARIFTGAPLPPGADSIVIQEDAAREGDEVSFNVPVEPGRFIGRAGEDIGKGETVLAAGSRLQPQDLGLAASVGATHLQVYRRPVVAIFSTGDELKEPGEALALGQIYNSNRYVLRALLRLAGCEIRDLGIIPDSLDVTERALAESAKAADLVITSGGVSVGDKDFLREALERTGELTLWKMRLKPGKPLVFGEIAAGDERAAYLGLPGNPVSVFVTFLMVCRPYIERLSGGAFRLPTPLRVAAGFEQKKPQTRRQFVRARLKERDGELIAEPYANQSSAVLVSTSRSDGLVVVREFESVSRGQPVEFYPYQGLL